MRKYYSRKGIPNDWKIGILIPLFKKGDISNCSNYRGIVLLSVVLKVHERIMKERVREILDKQLEESRNIFRTGRCCQDYIFTLKQISEKICVHYQNIYVGFVDIMKAFDSVSRKQILHSLRKGGIKTRLRNNIKDIYEVTRNYVRKEGRI